jgi:hypothetical protein
MNIPEYRDQEHQQIDKEFWIESTSKLIDQLIKQKNIERAIIEFYEEVVKIFEATLKALKEIGKTSQKSFRKREALAECASIIYLINSALCKQVGKDVQLSSIELGSGIFIMLGENGVEVKRPSEEESALTDTLYISELEEMFKSAKKPLETVSEFVRQLCVLLEIK